MNRFLVWLSGADRDILAMCTELNRSERIRFAGMGTLILIPAIVGSFSMGYAVSTLTDTAFLYVMTGLAWGLVVLFVDRYLVSTVHKSNVEKPIGRVASLLVRYIFAIVIGIAVAHPLVLLWFDGSITQVIAQNRREAVANRIEEGDAAVAEARGSAAPAAATPIAKQRADRVSQLDCLIKLQTYEQSTAKAVQLPCGATSGLPACGPRCQQIGVRINQLREEIAQFDAQLTAAQATDSQEHGRLQNKITAIQEQTKNDVADIETKFSDDYLARVAGLDQLADESRHVQVVSIFMVLLFVFVDIVPITMKLATPMGEYEYVRDTLVLQRRVAEEARRQVIRTSDLDRAVAQTHVDGARVIGEANEISNVPLQIIDMRDRQLATLERRIRDLRRTAGSTNGTLESDILTVRELDHHAWRAVMQRALDYLRRQ